MFVITAILMVVVGDVWAGKAKVNAKSDPEEGGYVYVANSAGSYSPNSSTDDATQDGDFWSKKDKDFYLYYKVSDSKYYFKGWYQTDVNWLSQWNSCDANSTTLTTNGQKVTHKADGGATTADYYYYAIFATLHNTTSPSFSTINVDKTTTATVTLKHAHANNVTLSITGDCASDFSVNTTSFYSNQLGTQTITITFNPNCAGTRTANLKITNDNGLPEVNIPLSAVANALPQTIAWDSQYDENMNVGGTLVVAATASTGQSVTYASSDPSVISVSGNTLTALKEGVATITASQIDGCTYETVHTQLEFKVYNKKTPVFWLMGDPNMESDNLKVEDSRWIKVENVDGMRAVYDPNLLSYSFDGDRVVVTALDAGVATLELIQDPTDAIFGKSRTFTFNITKYTTNTISNDLAIQYMVDDVIPEIDIYTINNIEVPVQVISGDENILKFENGQLKAVGAGITTVTVLQAETNKWVGISASKTIEVIKHTPEFTWNLPVYYNREVADFFSTTGSNALTYSSSDEDVATLSTSSNAQKLNLTTYNKEASTTLTVTQAENYYWYGKTETKVVTPIDPNNHVTFTITSANHTVFEKSFSSNAQWSGSGYLLGDGGWLEQEDYVIIQFTGVPDQLYFDKTLSKSLGQLPGTYLCRVYESINGTDWGEHIWESNVREEHTNDNVVQLSPTTRFLKFSYDGTVNCTYKNITVTELNELHAVDVNDDKVEVDTIYFAQQYVDNPVVTKKFALKYANAGYKVRLVSTDPQFTLNHTNIDTIGGEKYGTIKDFQVTYTPNKEHNTQSTDAKIRIYDECGKKDSIILVATTIKSTPTLRWTDAWSAKRPVLLLNQEVLDAAQSNNGYTQIKYRSSNPNAIEIINDGTAFRAKTVGDSAIITAYQEADRVYNAPEEIAKTFKVTDKMMQYIVWEDDLTKLYVDSEPVVLTAQVWVMTDAESGTWEYSAEQTAKLEYYSPNNGVVSVSNGTLYVHGTGELMLDAYVQADAIYEEVHTQIPVRVRDHSVVCTDEDLIIPLVGMNLSDELQYDPYALYDNEKIVEIDRSKGIPGSLHFSYRGAKAWGQLSGKIRVFESVDGGNNWSQVLSDADAVTPTTTTQYSPMIPLSRNATHLKFERYDDVKMGYHMIGYITVFPTKYIEAEDVDFGNVYVGNLISRNITFSYSSVRSDMDISTSHTKLTTTPTSISKECGAWGNESITITLNADASIVGEFSEQVQIYDEVGGIIETINVTANIIKNSPTITWSSTIDTIRSSADWESKKTAISSAGDEVQYEILSGNNDYARLDAQGKMILLRGGMITARAFTPENDRSNEVEQTRQFVIIVDPLFENTALDSDWHNPNNWNIGREPFSSDSATVLSNVLAMISHPIEILGLTLQLGSCVHIQSVAGIAVGNKGIRGAEDNSIIVDNTPNGAGFLKVDPLAANKPTNKVKINYTTCAYDSGSQRNEIWQYMGAPGTDMQMSDAHQTMIYHWDEQQGWLKQAQGASLTPFYGYAFTQTKAQEATFEISAKPIIPQADELLEISLTNTAAGMRGSNVFVNSFLAPIDLTTFEDRDFEGNVDKAFYLFNSGSWHQWQQNGGSSNTMKYGASPGQYYALSPYGSSLMDHTYDQTTIPPMQGVYVIARENGAKINLDYTKHVYNADASNKAMRAPQHQDDFKRIRLYVYGANSGADRMYLIQHDQCTSGYDNGYDAINMPTEGQVSIYSNEAAGQMEISITDRIDSSYIGFRAGMDSEYVLRMTSVLGEQLYLYDLQENTVVPIVDGTEYAFTATPNSVNDRRFLVTDKTSKSDMSDTEDVDVYIYDKKAYVKQAPLNSVMTVYTIGGLSMASYSVGNTPCVVDLSILPVGVYVLKVANKAYKFVCE